MGLLRNLSSHHDWRSIKWDVFVKKLKERPYLGVDFDGVIAKSVINNPTPLGIDAEPVIDPVTGQSSIDFLREAVNNFWVVICTARCCLPSAKGFIAAWLLDHGLEPEVLKQIIITDQKPPGVLIDDRAITFKGKFPTINQLKRFKAWHGGGIIDSDRGKEQ